ncbi:uncharacterized protein M6B38_150000 [Iris pallida]|uniref:Uncharacterized protein n=1 Tax=Iris pallida TaxID=29817 RepID=A0AAX6EPU2_IRIPA|nr:uncharacterized protein M6B38_177015 [Iris pallida]KAJ6812347.1 uncharacterized protein M6B38_150000 [Iris pallida]
MFHFKLSIFISGLTSLIACYLFMHGLTFRGRLKGNAVSFPFFLVINSPKSIQKSICEPW